MSYADPPPRTLPSPPVDGADPAPGAGAPGPSASGAGAEDDLPGDLEQALAEARRTGVNPLPVRALQIETSSICNFRCNSCALSMPTYDRPERHMAPEELERILDNFPDVEKIELQGVGEVFLNPRVLDIIRSATARGVRVHTFSNASVITRELAHGIVESGIEHINFSMDGADEPTFKKLRKGGTLKRYKRCVNNLMQARAALGSETPSIGIMSVLAKNNLHQVPQMLAIAEELGVGSLMFTKLNDLENPDLTPITLDAADREHLGALPPYRGKVQVSWATTPWTVEERMDCYWPKGMTYVTIEGDVTPCCNYHDSRELKLGNAFRQSAADIWNGEPYREFRRALLNGQLPRKCRGC